MHYNLLPNIGICSLVPMKLFEFLSVPHLRFNRILPIRSQFHRELCYFPDSNGNRKDTPNHCNGSFAFEFALVQLVRTALNAPIRTPLIHCIQNVKIQVRAHLTNFSSLASAAAHIRRSFVSLCGQSKSAVCI